MSSAHRATSSVWKKPAAVGAAIALLLSGIVGLQLFHSTPAAADWPDKGKPGTIQGKVYIDNYGSIEKKNPRDQEIPGVTMNAIVVKSDGTVIADMDENGLQQPFTVTTDANGFYSFNFKPAMEQACAPDCRGDDVKIAIKDLVRVWPDDSNYQPGAALDGKTPKRLNGGARFNKITTLNLSWLGMTNYVHGSISEFNFAYREQTKKSTQWGSNEVANHLPKDQWKPSSDHDVKEHGLGLNIAGDKDHEPFLCGWVFSDMTFRFDRWDHKGNRNANAQPDRVVPGVRVAVTTYDYDEKGHPTGQIQTRYDYSDKDGRWCVKWDKPSEVRPDGGRYKARLNVTIDAPMNLAEGKADLAALKKANGSAAYDSISPLVADPRGTGLPDGYSSVGLNAWYGTVQQVGNMSGVGYADMDIACLTRGSYCFPGLFWHETNKRPLAADGAEMGLIPTAAQAKYSRVSQDYGTDRQVQVFMKDASQVDNHHKVALVPVGVDPFDPVNHIATSQNLTDNAGGTITVPGSAPVGKYSLWLLSTDSEGNFFIDDETGLIQPGSLADVDSYQINDTMGHYYTAEAQQTAALEADTAGKQPDSSVTVVKPNTTLHNSYTDMALGSHAVTLVPRGAAFDDAGAVDKDSNLVATDTDNKYTGSYQGTDNFVIPDNQEPGNYDLVIVREVPIYAVDGTVTYVTEEVDRQPITVSGPILKLSKNPAKPGEQLSATITDLNPDGRYKLVYKPATGEPVDIEVTAGVTEFETPLVVSEAKGMGKVELVRVDNDNRVQASKPLLVSDKKVYGPQIILPGKQDSNANMDSTVFESSNWCNKSCDVAENKAKWGLTDINARLLRVDYNKTNTINIHAIDTLTGDYIPGGATATGATWTINSITFHKSNGNLKTQKATVGWKSDAADDANLFIQTKENVSMGDYFVVNMTVTNSAGLSDTKEFVLWNASGGQPNYGNDWTSTGGVFTVNEEIPAGKYCLKYGNPNTATAFGKSNATNTTNPWPEGVDIDSQGCLSGTPTAVTPGQDFVSVFARATIEGKEYDQNMDGLGVTRQNIPPTIRIAVREKPDEEPPVILVDGQDVTDGQVFTVEQGQALPFVITSTDETKHDLLQVDADKLPAGIDSFPAATAVSGTQLKVDPTSLVVAEDAEPGIYPVTISAMDKGENFVTTTININVTPKKTPPAFTDTPSDTTMPAGEVGTPYDGWTIPAGTNGGSPIKTVSSPDLPQGLSIVPQADGTFTVVGTPEEPTPAEGTPVTFTVVNADGDTVTKTYQLTVVDPPAPAWAQPSRTIELELGKQYTAQTGEKLLLSDDTQCTPTVTSQQKLPADATEEDKSMAAMMPPGLTTQALADNKGVVITGTAQQRDTAGTTYVVTATCGSQSATMDVTITVVDKTPPVVDKPDDVTMRDGDRVVIPISTVDDSGTQPTVTVTCRDKDTVLATTMDEGALVIDKPAKGTYTCTVTSTDDSGNKATEEFTVTSTGDPDPTQSTLKLSAHDKPIPDDGVEAGTPVTVVYTPKDANGNVTDVPGPVTVLVPVAGSDEPQQVTLTRNDEDGTWVGTITPSVIGDNTITSSVVPNDTTTTPVAGPQATLPTIPTTPASTIEGTDEDASSLTINPEAPMSGQSVTVTGVVKDKFGNPVANRQVTVKLPDGTTQTVTSGSDGTIGTPITYVAGQPGEVDTVQLFDGTDTTGTLLDEVTTRPTLKDVTPPTVTTINKDGISGITTDIEEGATVTATYPRDGDPKTTCTVITTTAGDGSYTMTWPTDCMPADDTPVKVTVTDPQTGTPSPATTKVVDMSTPPSPAIEPSDGTSISGTVQATDDHPLIPGSKVQVTIGDKTVTVPVDDQGHWTISNDQIKDATAKTQLDDGTTITACVIAPSGNKSQPVSADIDASAPQAPILTGNKDNKTAPRTVSGTAEAGSTVTITYTGNDGKTYRHDVVVGEDGTLMTTLPRPAKDGTTVSAVATDPAGNTSEESNKLTVDGHQPAPSINNIGNDQTASGTAEPNSTVVIYDDNNKEIARGKADADGNFSIAVPDDAMPADGKPVTAVSVDDFGNKSTPDKAIVDLQAPGKPTINPTNGEHVSGTTDKSSPKQAATVIVTIGDHDPVEVTVDSNGDWKVPADTIAQLYPSGKIPEGTTVTAVAKDSANNTSGLATTTVDGTAELTVDKDKLRVTSITDGHPTPVTGTTEKGAQVKVFTKDDSGKLTEVGTATVHDDGTWTYDSPDTDGDYWVQAKDPAGNLSAPKKFTVDNTPPQKPTLPTENDGKTLSGTAEPGAEVAVLKDQDGNELCTVDVDASGAFTIDLTLCGDIDNGDTLYVKVTDKAGNVSDAATSTVDTSKPTITVNKSDGKTITGTTDQPNTTVTITYTPQGGTQKIIRVDTDADGNFSATVPEGDLDMTKDHKNKLTASVTHPVNGKTNQAVGAFITQPITPPTVDPSNGKAVTGTAEPGTVITITDASGTPYGPVTVDGNGRWEIDLPDGTVLPEGNVTATAKDPDNFRQVATGTGEVDLTVPALVVPSANNGQSVTITGVSDDTVELIVTDESDRPIPATVVDNGDGTWTFTPDTPFNDGDVVKIAAQDDVGNVSPAHQTTADTTPPQTLTVETTDGDDNGNGGTVNATDPLIVTTEPHATVVISYTPDGTDTPVTVTGVADENGKATVAFDKGTPTDGSQVTVDAIDGVGNKTTSPVTLNVDSTAPDAPTVETDADNPTTITGTAEPGSTVTVCVTQADQEPVCHRTTADSDGTYTVTVDEPLDDDDLVSATATDPAGNTSTPTDTVVDFSAPDTPTVTTDADNPTTISGRAEPGSTVRVCVNGTCTTTVADDDGNYRLDRDTPLTDGDRVSVTATDEAGNTSDETTTTVDFTPPVAPTDIVASISHVTGKAGDGSKAGDTVTVYNDKGEVIGKTTVVDKDGKLVFSVPFTKGMQPNDGDQVTVTVSDDAGNESQGTVATVDAVPPHKPIIDPTQGNKGDELTVHVSDKDGTVTVTYIDDSGTPVTQQVTGPFSDDPDNPGRYIATVTLDKDAKADTPISVNQTDPAGNTSQSASVTPDRSTMTPVVDHGNGSAFTGTAEPGASVSITYTDEDGQEHTVTVRADKAGNFSTGKLDKPAATGTYSATATDRAGNSATGKVTVTRQAVPVSMEPTNGKHVTINIDAPAADIATIAVKYCAAPMTRSTDCTWTTDEYAAGDVTVDEDGTVTLPLNPHAIHGSHVTVTVTDTINNTGKVTGTVDAQAPDAPSIDTVTPTGVTGTAGDGSQPGDRVVVTNAAGDVIGEGVVNDKGHFVVTFDKDKQPADGQNVSVVVIDKAGNVSDPATATTDANAGLEDPVVDGSGTTVSGKADPGATIVITDDTGTVIGTGVADDKGNFTVEVGQLIDGQVVTVSATDAHGNTDTTSVVFTAPAPTAPQITTTDGDTITGVAQPGSIVDICVTTSTGQTCHQVTAGGDGFYSITLDAPLQPGDIITVKAINPLIGAVSDITTKEIPSPSSGGKADEPVGPEYPDFKVHLSTTGTNGMTLALLSLLLSAAGAGVVMARRRVCTESSTVGE